MGFGTLTSFNNSSIAIFPCKFCYSIKIHGFKTNIEKKGLDVENPVETVTRYLHFGDSKQCGRSYS